MRPGEAGRRSRLRGGSREPPSAIRGSELFHGKGRGISVEGLGTRRGAGHTPAGETAGYRSLRIQTAGMRSCLTQHKRYQVTISRLSKEGVTNMGKSCWTGKEAVLNLYRQYRNTDVNVYTQRDTCAHARMKERGSNETLVPMRTSAPRSQLLNLDAADGNWAPGRCGPCQDGAESTSWK